MFSLRTQMSDKHLLVIMGPTAAGKTGLALRLARHFLTEIVSADSRQIFSEMEIGTAKPTKEELIGARHHFIGSHSIKEDYDAGSFGREARALIDKLLENYSMTILCGGSGLYIKAALEGFDDLPDVTPDIRSRVIDEYREKGLAWLQASVEELDPVYFESVDRKNPQRLMRALEVYKSTGKPFSEFHKKEMKTLPFGVIKIGLELERQELYDSIDRRVEHMIEEGLFEEVERLFPQRHLNALQTVGYQEVFDFMEGKHDREEAIRLIKRNTRHYAKRQLTWFKKDKEIEWFRPEDWDGVVKYILARVAK